MSVSHRRDTVAVPPKIGDFLGGYVLEYSNEYFFNGDCETKARFDHRAAVLAYAFSADAPWAYSGGLDTSVRE
jgi:hypothetical protein